MDYDDKPKRGGTVQEQPCPICGNADYEWGNFGERNTRYYIPPGGVYGFGSGQYTEARKCLTCGNLQLFTRGE